VAGKQGLEDRLAWEALSPWIHYLYVPDFVIYDAG